MRLFFVSLSLFGPKSQSMPISNLCSYRAHLPGQLTDQAKGPNVEQVCPAKPTLPRMKHGPYALAYPMLSQKACRSREVGRIPQLPHAMALHVLAHVT